MLNNTKQNFRRFFWLWLFLVVFVFIFFGIQHIREFETTDEHYWMYEPDAGRISQYWDAVLTGNLEQTRINDKPGITLALISGIGKIFDNYPPDRVLFKEDAFRVYNPIVTLEKNFLYRVPLLMFNAFSVFLFYFFIKKLTGNNWRSLIAATLIVLSPIILGISQIINPDSLLWIFSTLAILSFVTFLENHQRKYAALAGIFLGFSLLTKYTAAILIPFFLLLSYLKIVFSTNEYQAEKKSFVDSLKGFLIAVIVSFSTISFFMPAVFVRPDYLWKSTLGLHGMLPVVFGLMLFLSLGFVEGLTKVKMFCFVLLRYSQSIRKYLFPGIYLVLSLSFLLAIANWSIGNNFLRIKDVPFDAFQSKAFIKTNWLEKIFLEMRLPSFTTVPIVLFPMFFIWIKSAFRRTRHEKLILYLSVFILAFLAGVIQQDLLVNSRYAIVLYPVFSILGALGIFEIWDSQKKKIHPVVLFLLVIIISIFSLYFSKPFYFNYSNVLISKNQNVVDAWGYGQYEAASFLNLKNDVSKTYVWTDHEGFCPFFAGRCLRGNEFDNIDEGRVDNIKYFVKSRRGYIKNKEFWDIIEARCIIEPVWEMAINKNIHNNIIIYENKGNK